MPKPKQSEVLTPLERLLIRECFRLLLCDYECIDGVSCPREEAIEHIHNDFGGHITEATIRVVVEDLR